MKVLLEELEIREIPEVQSIQKYAEGSGTGDKGISYDLQEGISRHFPSQNMITREKEKLLLKLVLTEQEK